MAKTSIELYKSYQLKLNKLSTNDNIDISPGEFVLIYNEVKNKWLISKYRNVSTRYLDDIQDLIESDYKLTKNVETATFDEFLLPDNFFDYIRSYSECSQGACTGRVLYNNEVKLVNLNQYLSDEYNTPSFDFEETIVTFSDGKLQVYKKDFVIDSVFFTYYRYPKAIDIAGYTKSGIPSTNVDPELKDAQLNEIIDMCVIETQRIYSDIEGLNLSQTRQ